MGFEPRVRGAMVCNVKALDHSQQEARNKEINHTKGRLHVCEYNQEQFELL